MYYHNSDRLRLVAVLPQASVAINVLTTVYSLAQAPAVVASVNVTEAAPQASDAVGKAKEGVSGHSIVVGAGTAEILEVYYPNSDRLRLVAVLPQASVAVNVLTTVYSLAQAPAVVASV